MKLSYAAAFFASVIPAVQGQWGNYCNLEATTFHNLYYPFDNPHFAACYPHVQSANWGNPQGADNGVAVFVGGNYIGRGGSAEVEGKMVVLGDLIVESDGPGNFISVGVGSQVLPDYAGPGILVGGNLEAYRDIQVFNQASWMDNLGLQFLVGGGAVGLDKWKGVVPTTGVSAMQNVHLETRYILYRKSQFWKTLPATGTVDFENWTGGEETWAPAWDPTKEGEVVYTCDANEDINVFEITPEEYYKINVVHTIKFSNECTGKTILINVLGCGDIVVSAAAMWHNNKMGYGANGFDTCMNQNILWNFPDAANVEIGGGKSSEFHGAILVAGNMEFTTSGHSGRTVVLGNLVHNGSGSEFHNYPYNPPYVLPDATSPPICENPDQVQLYENYFVGCAPNPSIPGSNPMESPVAPAVPGR